MSGVNWRWGAFSFGSLMLLHIDLVVYSSARQDHNETGVLAHDVKTEGRAVLG